MAFAAQRFNINVADKGRAGLIARFDSAGRAGATTGIRKDGGLVELRFLSPGTSRPWDDFDVEAARAAGGIRFAIGAFDRTPSAGTFTLDYDGDETASLDFDASAAEMQTALNALDSIASAGGVTVTKSSAGPWYRVTFVNTGDRELIELGDNLLQPSSYVRVSEVQVGDAGTVSIQRIELRQNPYVFQDEWEVLAITPVAIATSIAGDATHNEVQVVTLGAECYGGTFSLTLTLPNIVTADGSGTTAASFTVSASTTAADLQTLLLTHPEAVGDGDSDTTTANIRVTGDVGGPFSIEFVNHLGNRNIAAGTVADVSLLIPVILQAQVDYNTEPLLTAFDDAGGDTLDLLLEVEVQFPGQSPVTVLQVDHTVSKDVIDIEAILPAPVATYPLPGEIARASDMPKTGISTTLSGDTYCDVIFSTPFAEGFIGIVHATLVKPDAGDDNVSVLCISSDDLEEGFRAHFSAALPGSGWKLHWTAHPISAV